VSDVSIKLVLPSDPRFGGVVRATVEQFAAAFGVPDGESCLTALAVQEAVANIIRHAYGGKAGCPIEVTCRHLHSTRDGGCVNGIEVVLRDSGVPADPAKMKGRPLDEIRPGGLGLHFIRQCMDEVEFSRKKGKNQLRMVKYVAPAAPAAAPGGE